jgi:YVTN family beta-propeller protein
MPKARESALIEVDQTPHSATSSPDGAWVFVTHFRTGMVSVVDTAQNTVTKTLRVESEPGLYGIAAHPDGRIYVADNSRDFVTRVDPTTGHIGPGAGIGVRPYGLAINRDGSRLFAACPLDDRIEVLDALVKNMFRIRYNDFGVALAVSPEGDRLYITNYFSNTVSVLDISGLEAAMQAGPPEQVDATIVADVTVAQGPYGITLNPAGDRLYVAHFGSEHLVSVIDVHSHTVVETIEATHGMVRGVAVTDSARIYVTNYFDDSVSAIET